jgi:DNA-3-methyladenine glycosylase I
MNIKRCQWCGNDPLYQGYHDKEWGVPVYQDRKLFEMLILEGAQAGLSWITILKKRQNYRKAFDRFKPETIAGYGQRDIKRLLGDPGIVRNRLKVEATIGNARAYLALKESEGRFSDFLWQFVDGTPATNTWKTISEIPASTPESDAMSKALKHAGFKFVGSTICYAFMQAVGMVNDHTTDCFRYREIKSEFGRT